MTTDLLYDTIAEQARRAPVLDADELLSQLPSLSAQRRRHRRTVTTTVTLACAAVVTVGVGAAVLRDQPAPATNPDAATSHHADDTGLSPIAPAPADVEVSLGLVPQGWVYGGNDAVGGWYLDPDAPQTPDLLGKVTATVSEREPSSSSYPLQVAGHPAYLHVLDGGDSDGDYYEVTMLVTGDDGAPLEIDVDVPQSTGLSEDQVIAIADTVDIRSTAERAKG